MLKAEAIDMKSFPIYMDFNNRRELKSIFAQLQKRRAMDAISEIDSEEHRRIDNLAFDYLELPRKERARIVALLKSTILSRTNKSRT